MEERELPDWAQRVEIEQKELAEKASKLDAFIASNDFEKLGDEHQNLLLTQLDLMNAYIRILEMRLDLA